MTGVTSLLTGAQARGSLGGRFPATATGGATGSDRPPTPVTPAGTSCLRGPALARAAWLGRAHGPGRTVHGAPSWSSPELDSASRSFPALWGPSCLQMPPNFAAENNRHLPHPRAGSRPRQAGVVRSRSPIGGEASGCRVPRREDLPPTLEGASLHPPPAACQTASPWAAHAGRPPHQHRPTRQRFARSWARVYILFARFPNFLWHRCVLLDPTKSFVSKRAAARAV